MASAATAAAEQALGWPRRRARLLAVLTVLGFLAYKSATRQSKAARKNMRKVSRNPMPPFGLGRAAGASGPADIAVGDLMDFSEDESF